MTSTEVPQKRVTGGIINQGYRFSSKDAKKRLPTGSLFYFRYFDLCVAVS